MATRLIWNYAKPETLNPNTHRLEERSSLFRNIEFAILQCNERNRVPICRHRDTARNPAGLLRRAAYKPTQKRSDSIGILHRAIGSDPAPRASAAQNPAALPRGHSGTA